MRRSLPENALTLGEIIREARDRLDFVFAHRKGSLRSAVA